MTRYRNTDLDLISPASFESLTDDLESADLVLLGTHQDSDEHWHALSEDDAVYVNAEATISAIMAMLDSLSEVSKRAWCACDIREFNVAYDVGEEPLAFNDGFSVETLARMSVLNTSLRVTLYAERDDEG